MFIKRVWRVRHGARKIGFRNSIKRKSNNGGGMLFTGSEDSFLGIRWRHIVVCLWKNPGCDWLDNPWVVKDKGLCRFSFYLVPRFQKLHI